MASATTSASTAAAVAVPALPQLGALEEDDEFEEFAAEGMRRREQCCVCSLALCAGADWNEADEDHKDIELWDDNWDDDNVEDDFTVQLRYAIDGFVVALTRVITIGRSWTNSPLR